MNKFSIILPVKNGGAYLKECVNSILLQTCIDFNLLILDNNSDDGSSQWLQTINDERVITYPSTVSLSMEDNWARIKTIPKNEFMTIIGHDDIFHPGYLEEMNELITHFPDAGLYQTHFDFIDEKGDFIRSCHPMKEVQRADEFIQCHFLQTLDSMGTGYMFRSSDYDKLGGIPTDYPNLIFADYALWIKLTAISYKATSPKTMFYYRLHNSVSRKTKGEAYCIAFEKYIYFLSEMAKENEEIKIVLSNMGNRFLYYYCESLSHRLLKTATKDRKLSVGNYIEKCKRYATLLIPGQPFNPNRKWRIKLAQIIDSNPLSRNLFRILRK